MTTTYEVTFEGPEHQISCEYASAADALETVEGLRNDAGLKAAQITVAKVTREPVGLPDLRVEAEATARNPVTCEWFLMCTNDADGMVDHPTLNEVPTCRRCAEKLDLNLRLFPEEARA